MDTITLPLKDFIDELLPEGELFRTVNVTIANIIYGHYKNDHTVYVQFDDVDDHRSESPRSYILERPKIWRYKAWQESSALWRKQKAWSHNQRVGRWLRDANVKLVRLHIMKTMQFDETAAFNLAYSLVTRNKTRNILGLGVAKILTKEEEL